MIRQAHPGPGVGPYRTLDEKGRDAERYKREETIPWAVLADDLEGTVHQVYGGLADPTYLIDAAGRVAYYSMWTFAPNLDRAIGALLDRGGVGVVAGGIDHVVHPWPALVDGWKGIRRGLPQSADDLDRIVPGSAAALRTGHALRPLLGPIALRGAPLPPSARAATLATAALLGMLAARARR